MIEPGGFSGTDARRGGLVLLATCWGCVIVMAVTAAGTVILPEIARDMRTSQSQLQWIGDSYPLVLAAFLLPAGNLLDRYGRKRGLVLGLFVLTLALLWSGFADSPGMLIASRCLAGLAASLVFPATLATIGSVIPPERKGSAVGIWAATAIGGGLVGLLLAGGLGEAAWWGSVFLSLAGLAAVGLVLALVLVPETSEPEGAHLDPVGTGLSVLAIGAPVFAVTEAPVDGWNDPVVLGAFALGALALVAFITWELRTARPLLDLRVFRDRSLATSSAALFLTFFGVYGWFFLSMQYQVFVLGYRPIGAALGFLPAFLPIMALAPFAPTLARRYGRRLVIATGLAITAAGAAAMAPLGSRASYPALGVAFVVFGLGLSLASTPPTEAILDALPRSKQGVASAINDTTRELGAAVGIAVLGSAFNAGYRGKIGDAVQGVPEPLAEAVRSSPAAGFEALASAGASAPAELFGTIREGLLAGWRVAFVVTAAVLALCSAYVALCFPATRPRPVEASDPAGGLEGAA